MKVLNIITTILLFCTSNAYAKEVTETIKVITENLAHYRIDVTWIIEHFEDLPFVKPAYENWNIVSPVFPANSKAGVQWRFVAQPLNDRHGSDDFNLVVELVTKPSNSTLEARVACGIVDRNGKVLSKQSEEMKQNVYLHQLATREQIKLNAADVLPDGHLTLKCNIVGTLTVGDKNHVASEEITSKKIPISQCGNEIALDTLDVLSRYNYALRKDGVMRTGRHGVSLEFHKDIFSKRSPVLQKLLDNFTSIDFDHRLEHHQMIDLGTFLYTGTAESLGVSCKYMAIIYRNYGLECLRSTCEEVLIGQVREETARELLRVGLQENIPKLTKAAATCLRQGPKCNKI